MRMEDTYFVNRHGTNIWLSCGVTPRIDDTIIEIRPMIIAEPGKVLVKDGLIIGKAIWSRGPLENFGEVDEPVIEEPEEEPVEESESIEEQPEPEEEPVEEPEPIEEPLAEQSDDEQTFRIVRLG